jgi:biotin-(acetyl-CoA carboxylase) ligase
MGRILIENQINSTKINQSIVGIGININQILIKIIQKTEPFKAAHKQGGKKRRSFG